MLEQQDFLREIKALCRQDTSLPILYPSPDIFSNRKSMLKYLSASKKIIIEFFLQLGKHKQLK